METADHDFRRGSKRIGRGLRLRTIGWMLTPIVLALSGAWAFEEPAKNAPEVGLRGILPAEVPADLTDEAFAALNGNWQKWGVEVAEQVKKLYEGEDLDLEAQRKLLTALQGRLDTMERALGDRQYVSLHDQITTLQGRLAKRIEFAAAALDTLELDAGKVRNDRLTDAAKDVTADVAALDRKMNSVPGGRAWLGYVRAEDVLKVANKPTETEEATTVFTNVRDKIARRNTLEDQKTKDFLNQPEFVELEKSLGNYLATAAAPPKTVDVKTVRDALAKLSAGIEAYEASGLSADAGRIPAEVEVVAKASADDGDRIDNFVRAHYLNYNLQLVASERFLSKLVHEERNESGQVVDQVDEASVRGTQSTKTVVGVDTKPSAGQGQLNLTLSGRTNSNTQSYTSQAVIYSTGDHQFVASKPVYFDGTSLKMGPATIQVYPNVYHYSATVYGYESGLFSGTARRRALEEANGRRGRALEHARMRVTEQVLPRFESESQKEMLNMDDRLQNHLHARLKQANVFPRATSVATSETQIRLSSSVRNDGELGGDLPATAYPASGDAVLQVHESLINNALRRMNFAGRTMTDDEVRKELERFLSMVAGKEVKLQLKEPGDKKETESAGEPRAFIFAKEDPIRVEFEEGEIRLILRAGFEQEGKENIPLQQVTVPLVYRVEKDHILVERGNVSVAPVEKPQSVSTQIGYAGVIRKKIEKSIANRERERVVTIEREGKPTVTANVVEVKALSGWLILRLE